MLDDLLRALTHALLEVVCGATGHAVLWAVTLGRWRPFERCDGNSDNAAVVAGLLFWVGVAVGIWVAFR